MKLKKIFLGLLFIFSFTVITGCGLFNKKTTTIPFEERFNSLYPKILQIFDEDYEPDMEISDFIDEDLYEQYLNISKLSTIYTETMVRFNISEDNAINLLTDFKDLGNYGAPDYTTLLDFFKTLDTYGITPHILANLFVDVSMTFVNIYIENYAEEEIYALEQLNNLYNAEKDALVKSIEAVMTYLISVNNALDINKIKELLESDMLNPEEIFVIKDEIVEVLKETLPSIKDFENMLLIGKVAYNFFIGNNIDTLLDDEYIKKIATLNHHTYKLYVEFIDAIDYEFIEGIQDIVGEDSFGEYCYYDDFTEEFICVSENIEMEMVIELILYFDDFYKTFRENNRASFDTLIDIYKDEDLRQIHENIIKKGLEYVVVNYLELPDEYLEAFRNIISDMIETAKLIEEAEEIVYEYGINIYENFINTEGAILLNYERLYQALKDAQIYEVNIVLADLLDDIIDYNNISLAKLTKAQINKIVKSYISQLKYNLLRDIEELEEFNQFVEIHTNNITEIVYELIQVEKAFLSKLSENGFELTDFEDVPELDIEDSLNQHIIIALDYVLDENTKNSIRKNFSNYFNTLSGYDYLFDYYDIEEHEYYLFKRVNYIFDCISEFAEYDFKNLDSEQLEKYQEFLDVVFTSIYDE